MDTVFGEWSAQTIIFIQLIMVMMMIYNQVHKSGQNIPNLEAFKILLFLINEINVESMNETFIFDNNQRIFDLR
jgi:hypothetical protein